ncbi:MAG: helix-turn-helix transcriptional regulator [Actinomycetota bacterium]
MATSTGGAGRKPKKPSQPGVSYPGLEQLGDFIRAQRKMLELSQRELAKLMEVSDPYVSQLERGMHEPSVRVLKALAGALNVRAETLLSYAGLLDPDQASTTVVEAIQADPHLTDDQKTTLLSVYQNFRATSVPAGATSAADDALDLEPDGEADETGVDES